MEPQNVAAVPSLVAEVPVVETGISKSTFIVGLIISVVVVVGAIYVLNNYSEKIEEKLFNKPKKVQDEEIEKSPFVVDVKDDLEGVNSLHANGKPKIVLVHAPWCGHCRNMMGDFVKAAAEGYGIEWIRVDSKVSPSVSRRSDLRGFPTIYGVSPDGQVTQHNGARDADNLLKFASSMKNLVPTIPSNANVKAVNFED